MKKVSQEEVVKNSAEFLHHRIKVNPQVAIIAGSGLGEELAEIITDAGQIPYREIPDFPISTVTGHKGELIYGKVSAQGAILFSGRKHLYEGESLERVVFPVLLIGELKVPRLILTNAAGGLNPEFNVGDLMLISEGVDLTFRPFLLADFLSKMRLLSLDTAKVFSPEWREKVLSLAKERGIFLRSGVYVATTGPSYETPAEVSFLRYLGGDAIGMSTVPEAIAAAALGIEVLGISFISNRLAELPLKKTTHEEVIGAAAEAAPRLAELIKIIIAGL